MNQPKFTPGPWRVGKKGLCVVADGETWNRDDDDSRVFYGGNLVCESVAPENVAVIAAAPAMYKAISMLPLYLVDNYDMEIIDAADFVDHANDFIEAMRAAREAIQAINAT